MDATWSPELKAFAEEVRQFARENLSAETRERVLAGHTLSRADHMGWQDALACKGWLAGFWPREWGGCGWSAAQSYIFQYEAAMAGAPWVLPFGINYVGPVISTYGSPEQKEEHLPGIVSNKVFWCQGYSEPEAGSDLAALKTRAVREGDQYIVNGTKTWTTHAQWADWIFALVRTDPDVKPQAGISFLLIDLRSRGISISPIITIEGAHHVNQVFFEDVRVPVRNLIGEENKGWGYAKFLLGHERLLSADVGRAQRFLDRVMALAGERRLGRDQRFLDRFHRLEADVMALEWTTLRMLDTVTQRGGASPEVSILKLSGTEVLQRISEVTVDVLGLDALPYDPEWIAADAQGSVPQIGAHTGIVAEFLHDRVLTIWGGSSEVQRTIIAKHALGL